MLFRSIFYAICDAAVRGVDQFEGKPIDRNQMLVNLGLTLNGLVTADSSIKTLDDFSRKTILLPPNGAMNPFAEAIYDRVDPSILFEGMDQTQRVEATLSKKSAGMLFAAFAMTPELDKWTPNPACQEFASRADYVGFISTPQDIANEFIAEPGGRFEDNWQVVGTIPALASDERQTDPWSVFINNCAYFADQDMEDEVVLEALSILVEHRSELVDYHPQAAMLSKPDVMAVYAGPIWFHPAAEEYFKSIGVTPMWMSEYLASITG